ncbi:hypothetical protein PAXINDRAFT_81706 [Paxillus involutus ATCC 200175]|uniref:Uncharacterized protein n=1 Tax=Paxillus involutus ATCC 200175 TaxID=664439 RepID=A0A0C9TRY7_PAXIN|nr:hypothetical protein PAXINDRAFT_81706 [Paxillus involutus ATCC 200175]
MTAFTNDDADINCLYLQLDHIQGPMFRPLDELLIGHFMQGLFRHMTGAGEQVRTCEDREGTGTGEGKEQFESALTNRLFDHRV